MLLLDLCVDFFSSIAWLYFDLLFEFSELMKFMIGFLSDLVKINVNFVIRVSERKSSCYFNLLLGG